MSISLIGIGNSFRRDDGVGIAIVNRLKAQTNRSQDIVFLECSGEGAELMELWAGFDRVFLFDAVMAGKAPGTIHRFDASLASIPSDFFKYSSHAFSLAEAVEMARILGRLPGKLIVFGIEGTDFKHGEGLSPAVQEAIDIVTERVLREI